ncbi:Chloride Channel (ClC) Family [Phytophthora infestans T30-4]|uniref:Chloride Channel (ClC) Family n=1 Tax=Phytophthora infestans (strain T30-4) TaxID=403677 RepID=D0N5D4_PHYIT|nr:Chloride Channel (ClC) Family [Phytophthora infestans T30-4]EEY70092.1 Chloride Channel (ClC) Family [Phytophthora infestans T30-4]|eukprot:XP_002998739.1 Chloride Channel (ClC) Family [Phytophthora infestans T30-4]
MLGVSASLVDDIIDLVVLGLNRTRQEFLKVTTKGEPPYIELAAWSAFTIAVATASVTWTDVFDPMAAGSGIPEMKSIISYDHREDAGEYLRARTLVSKIGGLALALSSGLSLGKEGPFVHTSSIIAHRLMKHLKWFHRIYESDIMRRHVYNAACAVGVTCTFRAPIGGALFAIEVTSTVFMVSNYWRAFVVSTSALLARQTVYMVHQDWVAAYHPMFPTTFEIESFTLVEIVAFAALAVLTGLLGATFGRLFGEVLQLVFPSAEIVAGGYALAGGAGFVASTTNTTSVAVIAMEFTGQFVYSIPLMLSVIVASGVGCALRVSVYDSVIAKKGFTYLYTLDLEGLKARDVMLRRFPILSPDMDVTQLGQVLSMATSTPMLPVVESLNSMMFIGCVPRCELENVIHFAMENENQYFFHFRSVLKLPKLVDIAIPSVTGPTAAKDDAESRLAECTADEPEATTKLVRSAVEVVFDAPIARKFVQETPLQQAQPPLEIDSTALQVDPDKPLEKVHLLFEMIKCSSIWVTRQGRLVGLLHRQNLHIRVAELKLKGARYPACSGH